MVPSPKDVIKYYDDMRKRGRAIVRVIFKSAPNDESFLQDDPVANVTVVVKDGSTGKEMARESWRMSAKEWEHSFEIQLVDVHGVLKRIWHRLQSKPKPPLYKVTISVQPLSEWQADYSGKEFSVEADLGPNPPQHVWLLRTSPTLSKPKLK